MVTDNMVFGGCFYKADSYITTLHEIALQIHRIGMWGDFILHVLHVMGMHMKELGIDGFCVRIL